MKRFIGIQVLVVILLSAVAFAVPIQTLQPFTPWTYDQDGDRVFRVDPAGNANVAINDQSTPTIIARAFLVTKQTTLLNSATLDDEAIKLTDATGVLVGDSIRVISLTTDRFYIGTVIGLNSAVVTLDYPLDSDFQAGDTAAVGTINLAVDGSVTPQIFTLRAGDPGIGITVDITRIIIICETDTAVDLTKFGDLAPLERGLLFRRVDGFTQNIVGWKDNFEIAGTMFDWTPLAATNPQQGVDGFIGRFTAGGQNKLGVVWRVSAGEDLEMHVRDDLTGLVRLSVYFEGHVVE